MKREIGDRSSAIWLLGDSEPANWKEKLDSPFDPRHPIRHNIWTSILDVIQEIVYQKVKGRLCTSSLYIRNAVKDSMSKPDGRAIKWSRLVCDEIVEFKSLLSDNQPRIVLCFGAFSFEFARRSLNETPEYGYRHWKTQKLGEEFRNRIGSFSNTRMNILPLLHRSIAGGRFIQSHDYFCGKSGANYFTFVGSEITNIILNKIEHFNIC